VHLPGNRIDPPVYRFNRLLYRLGGTPEGLLNGSSVLRDGLGNGLRRPPYRLDRLSYRLGSSWGMFFLLNRSSRDQIDSSQRIVI
jgi:hypothetical protein